VGYRLAAWLVVVVHLAFVAFALVGGFVAWRWPSLIRLHVPALVLSASLAVAGLDCPLTDVEKWLRRRAGDVTYRDGFIAHYLVAPVHPAGMTPTIRVGLRVFTVVVVAASYTGVVALRPRLKASRS
jgi:hypothetical protein